MHDFPVLASPTEISCIFSHVLSVKFCCPTFLTNYNTASNRNVTMLYAVIIILTILLAMFGKTNQTQKKMNQL